MSRRAMLGGVIVAAWLAGIGVLIQREFFRPQLERLAEVALKVTPGAVYFGVMKHDQQVGFASSTIDTTTTAIVVSDYFVADTTTGTDRRRIAQWTDATLTRGMRISKFATELDGNGPPQLAGGRFIGDSVLVVGRGAASHLADSEHVAMSAQALLPNMMPLAIALMERPKVGKSFLLPMLDPKTMTQRTVAVRVAAESLFTIADSAVFDSTTARWKPAHSDTVRAWRLAADSNAAIDGWVDEHGRLVRTTQLGFDLQRLPYEIAFENWKADSLNTEPGRGGAPFRAEIRPTPSATSLAQERHTPISSLQLVISGVDLSAFALTDGRQRLSKDTLFVSVDDLAHGGTPTVWRGIRPPSCIPSSGKYVGGCSSNPVQVDLVRQIIGDTHDETEIAKRLVAWVHDSIALAPSMDVNVLSVQAMRKGDAFEHAQLFVALARAAGIPGRFATGLRYSNGGFYYHVWSDVLLGGRWIAVDPTFGEFPADASHVFLSPRLMRQADFLRLVAPMRITVLSVGTQPRRPPR